MSTKRNKKQFGVNLRRLSIWQKLALIVVPVLLPVSLLLLLSYSASSDRMRVAAGELKGLEYCRSIRTLAEQLQDHRGLCTFKQVDFSYRQKLLEKQQQIDSQLIQLQVMDDKYGDAFQTTTLLNNLITEWNTLKNQSLALPAEQLLLRHATLLRQVAELNTRVAEASALVLDPVVDSYWLQLILFDRTPDVSESLSQSRALIGVAPPQKTTNEQKLKLEILQAQSERIAETIRKNLNSAFAYNPELKAKLEPSHESFQSAVASATTSMSKFLSADANGAISQREAYDALSRAISSLYVFYDQADAALNGLLQQRILETEQQLFVSFGLVVLTLMLVGLIAFTVARGITQQVYEILRTFSSVSGGNFEARAEQHSEDELGEVASSLNQMLDKTVSLMQMKNERDQIQSSIMKLLDEVSGVAEGDLSKEAEVTADMTGAIADSFNYMIGELREIIGQVKLATAQVSNAAGEIQETAESLAEGSEEQAAAIVSTSVAVEEMAESIRQVSENANRSAEVARTAKKSAKQGSEAVNNTIQGMNRIRDHVQETSKRIKRLGESTQQIGEIVQLINDIAERTGLLALNASIQAAMAGEAGRGFAIVAEEVERLAVRSTSATQKIATLVKTIQVETNEAITAMEENTQEVVHGSKLAKQAGEALGQIELVSAQLDDLIQSISSAATKQARVSEDVATSMSQISSVTQQTAAGTKQAAASVNQLAEMAEDLRSSVSRFRLPDEATSASGRYTYGSALGV